jgi:hypothetical protein
MTAKKVFNINLIKVEKKSVESQSLTWKEISRDNNLRIN